MPGYEQAEAGAPGFSSNLRPRPNGRSRAAGEVAFLLGGVQIQRLILLLPLFAVCIVARPAAADGPSSELDALRMLASKAASSGLTLQERGELEPLVSVHPLRDSIAIVLAMDAARSGKAETFCGLVGRLAAIEVPPPGLDYERARCLVFGHQFEEAAGLLDQLPIGEAPLRLAAWRAEYRLIQAGAMSDASALQKAVRAWEAVAENSERVRVVNDARRKLADLRSRPAPQTETEASTALIPMPWDLHWEEAAVASASAATLPAENRELLAITRWGSVSQLELRYDPSRQRPTAKALKFAAKLERDSVFLMVNGPVMAGSASVPLVMSIVDEAPAIFAISGAFVLGGFAQIVAGSLMLSHAAEKRKGERVKASIEMRGIGVAVRF